MANIYVYILLAALVGAVVYIYMSKRFRQNEFSVVVEVAEKIVHAVEQQYHAQTGGEKKAIAVDAVKQVLAHLGYRDVPDILIDKAIELAVFAMNRVRQEFEQTKKAIDSTGLDAQISVSL